MLDAEQCDPGVALSPGQTSAGCTADCRIDCTGGFLWPANNHCYTKAQNKEPTLLRASHVCPSGTHIVTFASQAEFEAVAGAIDAGPFWVGLVGGPALGNNEYNAQQLFEPGWSPTCSGCYARTDEASAPLPGIAGQQECVKGFSYLDASWQQWYCSNADAGALYVICEREPPGRPRTGATPTSASTSP